MDRLTSVYIDRTGDWVRSGNDTGKYYLKSEADKVIAELRKVCNDKDDWCLHTLKENHHQKRKRCLALHEYCLCELEFAFRDPCAERSTRGCARWRKWANLWLELAYKFKETK